MYLGQWQKGPLVSIIFSSMQFISKQVSKWCFIYKFSNLLTTILGANTIKGATRCVTTTLKCNCISLKKQKRSIINWVFNFFSFKSSITYKVSLFKTWCKLMMFQEFFAIVTILFFYSNVFFPYQMCTILIKIKIEGDLNNDDYKNRSSWNWNFSFWNTFEHICFKCVFDLKNYEIWKCVFKKIIHFFVI